MLLTLPPGFAMIKGRARRSAMKVTTQIQDGTATIRLEGRFTFESHPAFRSCVMPLLEAPGLERMVLDMARVSHMDASSLGLILILRDHAQPHLDIVLQQPSQPVLKLLKIVQFEKLFTIQP
jgi:anti-anti-sigma factor